VFFFFLYITKIMILLNIKYIINIHTTVLFLKSYKSYEIMIK